MITGGGLLRIVLAAGLVMLDTATVPAAAGPGCTGTARVFAVDAGTGHLNQIRICSADVPRVSGHTVVDSADWRAYRTVFGMSDGDAVVVYTVSPGGELWWQRQDAPDAALSPPIRVADSIDWRHDVVFAPRPGYLAFGDFGAPMRTFRHDGWDSGGAQVVEQEQLFAVFHGPRIAALVPESGYALGEWDGVTYKVWRDLNHPGHDDVWYPDSDLPAGVSGVTGNGTTRYGVDSGGVVLLRATSDGCDVVWRAKDRSPGQFSRVVVPVRSDPAEPPVVSPPPADHPSSGPMYPCRPDSTRFPWEWQG